MKDPAARRGGDRARRVEWRAMVGGRGGARRERRAVGGAIVAVTACLTLLGPLPTRASVTDPNDNRGNFSVACAYSHSRADDPIVYPGQPGASHLHDFFGNRTTMAYSVNETNRVPATTCTLLSDASAYWAPTAFMPGRQVKPRRVAVYYFGLAKGTVATIPAGLQMISGDKEAVDAARNPRVRWTCGSRFSPQSTHPYNCERYRGMRSDGVAAQIEFQRCWNGTGTAPADVAYRGDDGCPVVFPFRLPSISMRIHYPVMDPCRMARPCGPGARGGENVVMSLSSGPYYTMHADFWNTWIQRRLDELVNRCLRHRTDCGILGVPG